MFRREEDVRTFWDTAVADRLRNGRNTTEDELRRDMLLP